MRLASLSRRIAALESEPINYCPFCECLSKQIEALSDDELRKLIAFLDGNCAMISLELETFLFDVPESSPTCPHCHETATMSEEELEEHGQWLVDTLRKAV